MSTQSVQDEAISDAAQSARSQLVPSTAVRLDHFTVPDALKPYLITLFHLTCDEPQLEDTLPAGVGFVQVVLRGTAGIAFTTGAQAATAPVQFLSPTSGASRVRAAEPFHMIGAALSPAGWGALTGRSAFDFRDQVIACPDLFAPADLAAWRDGYDDGSLDGAGLCDLLAQAIAHRIVPLPPQHAALLGVVSDWMSSSLNPQLADLVRASIYSERQTDRLVKRYFGATPRELARKYRALRVAALLHAPDCTDEQAAALADLFYDQSHMIREMRHFLGRTPSRLADEESAMTEAINGIGNFRERRPSFARLPEG